MSGFKLFGLLFKATSILTWIVMIRARRVGMLDFPNDRSSHVAPAPRGGGLAIGVAMSVAAIGYLDDARGVGVLPRAAVHFIAAIPAVVVLGGLPEIFFGSVVISPNIWGVAIAAIAVVWFLNPFNFMDGIDGIAASEAIFMAGGGAGQASASQRLCGSLQVDITKKRELLGWAPIISLDEALSRTAQHYLRSIGRRRAGFL